jgi:hypothetical protein
MLAGTLSGVEMGLRERGVALAGSGVAAALNYLSRTNLRPDGPAGS